MFVTVLLYSTLRTVNISVYSLKQCVTLHKILEGLEQKLEGGVEPLTPIARATTGFGSS